MSVLFEETKLDYYLTFYQYVKWILQKETSFMYILGRCQAWLKSKSHYVMSSHRPGVFKATKESCVAIEMPTIQMKLTLLLLK